MVDTAIILAAGMGMRLEARGQSMPKGFLEIAGKPLIAYSIEALLRHDIKNIVIVTGHQSQFYEDLSNAYDRHVQLVHNKDYQDSGSLYSLYLGLRAIQSDALVLESDIIFDPAAIRFLLDQNKDDCLLCSGASGSGDEVHVETDEKYDLIAMSKSKDTLGPHIIGEMTGLTKLSAGYIGELISLSEQKFKEKDTLHFNYEDDGFTQMARRGQRLHCPVIPDLIWTEIDTEAMYMRAKDTIYPRLQERIDAYTK